jgi:hypothetical protein
MATLLAYTFAHQLRRAAHQHVRGFFPGPLGEGCEANRVRELKTNLSTEDLNGDEIGNE